MNAKLIKLTFSTDHSLKRTSEITIPFSFYMKTALDDVVLDLYPNELSQKIKKAKSNFEQDYHFLSYEDQNLYVKTPFIHTLCGPDVYRFFSKLLSLNYQANKHFLKMKAGSIEEYFQEGAPFWNEDFLKGEIDSHTLKQVNDCLFFSACISDQIKRYLEKQDLNKRLDQFARDQLRDKDQTISSQSDEIEVLKQQIKELEQKAEKTVHFVPGDPYHLLGLEKGELDQVEKRATTLIKVLHPDRSGSKETAYLFDLIVKARDEILQKS